MFTFNVFTACIIYQCLVPLASLIPWHEHLMFSAGWLDSISTGWEVYRYKIMSNFFLYVDYGLKMGVSITCVFVVYFR